MNIKLYEELMKQEGRLAQNPPEWKQFLEFCEMYLTKHRIKNPIVVELGTLYGMQKRFYEDLLGARHISIDSNNERSVPDITGFTEDPKTLTKLKDMLGGRPINILFIDASHRYKYVSRDFKIYSPLCSDIVAFHDIEVGRHSRRRKHDVFVFWDELKELSYSRTGQYEHTMFIEIRQCRQKRKRSARQGIGMMIKNGIDEKGAKAF